MPARMNANGNFRNASFERFYSVRINCMSPSDAIGLGHPCNSLFEFQVVHRYVFIWCVGNDVIFQCLWRHSCQFKPQKFSIVFFLGTCAPPLWKRFRHPCLCPSDLQMFFIIFLITNSSYSKATHLHTKKNLNTACILQRLLFKTKAFEIMISKLKFVKRL